MDSSLLTVNNLKVRYPMPRGVERMAGVGSGSISGGYVRAIDDLTFQVKAGTICGVVGESGAGKTTLAQCIARLVPAHEGDIYFGSEDILTLSDSAFRPYRKRLQITFEDSLSALNPRMTVRRILGDSILAHDGKLPAESAEEKVQDLLKSVGLPEEAAGLYPGECSLTDGQRIQIARALVPNPKLLVLDEPTSRLDPAGQAEILNLIRSLHEDLELTVLLLTPQLAVAQAVAEHLVILYRGKLVETGDSGALIANPQEEYTKKLLAAAPVVA